MERPSFSIYDASAGSGKTYALVKEYLKIILTSHKNDAYRNILAITFTNKAVHEMKSRILGNLSEFASENPSEKAVDFMKHIVSDTKTYKNPLSIAEIKTKSNQIIKHIIHNYAAFDISTIDKFTHRVIRSFAIDLGLSVNFEVSLETENLLIQAVDGMLSRAGEDQVLTKLLVDFALEKTDDDKSWDISQDILSTGKLLLNENNRNEIAHFENKNIEDFLSVKAKLNQEVKLFIDENSKIAKEALHILEQNLDDLKSFSFGTFPNHLQFIINDDVRVNKYKFINVEDVSVNSKVKNASQIAAILPEVLALLGKVYENNQKKNFYQAFLKNITPLSLLNTVSKELKSIQEEQNILPISEFNAIIRKEIQNQPAPFIYERLGERYRHFFIDEFQDTSEMQWQNLIPLIDNATSSEIEGEKGTLMIVGDPKQSIYRWRGGKAEQFIALSKNENPFNNPQKVVTPLYQNYRSYSEIIDFNNTFFEKLAAEFDNLDYADLYKNHVKQEINSKIGGYVNITFLSKIAAEYNETSEDKDEDLDLVDRYTHETLKIIESCLEQGFEYKDIAVLTRKRKQGVAVANYLTEKQIPILSSETLMIQNDNDVQMIVSLLNYINNAEDQISKANFLYYFAVNLQIDLDIHDFIALGMTFKTEFELEQWLKEFNILISFRQIRKKSLYEAVEIIIFRLLDGTRSNAYVQYFLDIILDKDTRNQIGISDFIEYWSNNGSKFSIPSPEGINAVKIMTVHKSKGLEFPVVIFPFADEDYYKNPKDKLWLDSDEQAFGIPKVLINNSKAIEEFGADAGKVYSDKKEEELLDNINILYVTLTRAEEQLYIISTINLDKQKVPRKNNMSSYFVNYLAFKNLFDENKLNYAFGNNIRLSPFKKHIDNVKPIIPISERLDFENIKIAQKEALLWGTLQQDSIEYGNLVHKILSSITTSKDIDSAIEKALENGLLKNNESLLVRNSITDIVFHADLQACFSDDVIVFNEQIIIQKEGRTIIPDRIVLNTKNEIHLLDYKTGKHQAKYKTQLENYQNTIEKMGFKVVKKSLVYIGVEIDVLHLDS